MKNNRREKKTKQNYQEANKGRVFWVVAAFDVGGRWGHYSIYSSIQEATSHVDWHNNLKTTVRFAAKKLMTFEEIIALPNEEAQEIKSLLYSLLDREEQEKQEKRQKEKTRLEIIDKYNTAYQLGEEHVNIFGP